MQQIKKEAEELVEKFYDVLYRNLRAELMYHHAKQYKMPAYNAAKQCAVFYCQQLIKMFPANHELHDHQTAIIIEINTL
jgi:hypothetical protein